MSQTEYKAPHCEDCGAVISREAADGLCVACLLAGVLGDSEDARKERDTLSGGHRLRGKHGEGGPGET